MKRRGPPPNGDYEYDRRYNGERRYPGRPRLLTDARLTWALEELGLGRRQSDVARDLNICERTLERRVVVRREEDRRRSTKYLGLVFRCPDCRGSSYEPICPYCKTVINPMIEQHRKFEKEILDGDEQA